VSAKQLHNAHYQSGEAIIRYGFHPRCGETVIVTGRNRHGDEVALTIRQPDGTLAQLPIWIFFPAILPFLFNNPDSKRADANARNRHGKPNSTARQ
jgi:hypothetical protein